jgi:hypothetical protein
MAIAIPAAAAMNPRQRLRVRLFITNLTMKIAAVADGTP